MNLKKIHSCVCVCGHIVFYESYFEEKLLTFIFSHVCVVLLLSI